jgi:Xaa-Pro aminopeptidase
VTRHATFGLPPTWNEQLFYLAEDNKNVLMPGMVFHLVPFLRVPGKYGVALSETILITESGCEVLTDVPGSPPRDLIVIPEDQGLLSAPMQHTMGSIANN